METKDLRTLLLYLPRLSDLSPWLLDDSEYSHSECDCDRVNRAWTELESINIILSNLLEHRPLQF